MATAKKKPRYTTIASGPATDDKKAEARLPKVPSTSDIAVRNAPTAKNTTSNARAGKEYTVHPVNGGVWHIYDDGTPPVFVKKPGLKPPKTTTGAASAPTRRYY